jgi:hypothetical protein
MSFKLLEEERTYLELLKETKMLKHVGSGPVDPAPKEKETKSPVEDGTGTGTKQAATGHPNKIPPIAYLKKELAKEGIQLMGSTAQELKEEIMSMPPELKAFVKRTLSEMKENDKEDENGEEDEKDENGEKDEKEEKEDDEGEKKVSKEGILQPSNELELALEMCGKDHGIKKSKKKVTEQEDVDDAADDAESDVDVKVDDEAVDEQVLAPTGDTENDDKDEDDEGDEVKADSEAEAVEELTKTRSLARRMVKSATDPAYRERKQALTVLRKQADPQARKRQSKEHDLDIKKTKQMAKHNPRVLASLAKQTKTFHGGPLSGRSPDVAQSRRDVAKTGGWERTTRLRNKEYQAQVKAREKKEKANEGKEISNEQGFSPRGSTSDKIAARMAGSGSKGRAVAGSPADRSAKMAAFEKQKAIWAQQQKAKAASLPANVVKQRRPVMA